jgi:Fic family protein
MSAYLDRHRDHYMDAMLQVSQKGAWTEWIDFFVRGVAEQANDASRRSQTLLALWRDYRARTQTARSSALLLQVIDELFAIPVVTAAGLAKRLHVTHRSAQLNIDKLLGMRLVHEVTGRERRRVYIASEILALLEPGESDHVASAASDEIATHEAS